MPFNHLLCGELQSPLMADPGLWSRFGDKFRLENAQLGTSDLLVAICVVAVGVATAWLMTNYMRRSERPKSIDNQKKLFHELCKVHQLERHETALLKAVAEGAELDDPSLLFIDPGLLDAAILDQKWVEESAELARYRELFFGDESTTPRPASGEPAVA